MLYRGKFGTRKLAFLIVLPLQAYEFSREWRPYAYSRLSHVDPVEGSDVYRAAGRSLNEI